MCIRGPCVEQILSFFNGDCNDVLFDIILCFKLNCHNVKVTVLYIAWFSTHFATWSLVHLLVACNCGCLIMSFVILLKDRYQFVNNRTNIAMHKYWMVEAQSEQQTADNIQQYEITNGTQIVSDDIYHMADNK